MHQHDHEYCGWDISFRWFSNVVDSNLFIIERKQSYENETAFTVLGIWGLKILSNIIWMHIKKCQMWCFYGRIMMRWMDEEKQERWEERKGRRKKRKKSNKTI